MSATTLPPPPAPKEPVENLLSTPRPKPTRYKPGLILALVFGSATLFAAALVYGLFVPQKPMSKNGQDDSGSNNGNMPQFGNFPSGYGQVTALPPTPKLIPQPPPPTPANPRPDDAQHSPMTPMTPENSGQAAQETPAEIAADKARASNIFFMGTTDPSLEAEGASGALGDQSSSAQPALALAAPGGGAGQPAPGSTDEKSSFVVSDQNAAQNDYTGTSLQSPVSAYEVQAGSIIPAALLTAVDSDLPGDVTAQVTENVYDSATGKFLLIPQGTRLYGRYDSLISYAQTRALIVWNRLIFPDGKSIDLGGMIGTDATGQSGLQDQVNRHLWGLTGALAAATIVSIGPELALSLPQSNSSSGGTNIYTAPAENLGQNVNNLGQEFVSKELNRPNTITIRAGFPLNVLVNKDIVLGPYSQ